MKTGWYEPVEPRRRLDYRNGFYERDFVTRLGNDSAAHREHAKPEFPAERVCFVNVASVDRIIYSIFQRFNLEWRNRTSASSYKPLDITCVLLRSFCRI
jgi:hypothetical protein